MLSSLQRLLTEPPTDDPEVAYRTAVMVENVLSKEAASGQEWAFSQFRRFYALAPCRVAGSGYNSWD